jgi:predicted metal-binding membrane protein
MNTPTTSQTEPAITNQPRQWLLLLGMMIAGLTPLGVPVSHPSAHTGRSGERGAVSLEQVLWFVAAGLSVAVVAGILWTQIRTQANTPINVPSAP